MGGAARGREFLARQCSGDGAELGAGIVDEYLRHARERVGAQLRLALGDRRDPRFSHGGILYARQR